MSLEISRLIKLLVDAEGLSTAEAEARLRSLTLEIVVGDDAHNTAGHNAVLTAVAVGVRSFVGGVEVTVAHDSNLWSHLPLGADTLGEAVSQLGARPLDRRPAYRIAIGHDDGRDSYDAHAWWDGWKAGGLSEPRSCGSSDNPLAGIVAGAACVAAAFAKARGRAYSAETILDLWPGNREDAAPPFFETYLPGSLWIIGMGNLGQANLWCLSSLPYPDPTSVQLVLQDRDCVSAENWGTSILVRSGQYGGYKTRAGEQWAQARGFDVRRVDRWLDEHQRVQGGEPLLALSGLDSIEARRAIDNCGFEGVIDAGLGNTHTNFDTFRVTIFDPTYPVATHFDDEPANVRLAVRDYEKLAGLDSCGATLFAGVAIASPFVSAIAAALSVARAIAISCGIRVPRNQVVHLSRESRSPSQSLCTLPRGLLRVAQV